MQQATLPFHYAEENESTGMTALSGLPAYLDLAFVARLGESVRRHVGVREGTQGWTDAQMVTALVMLNLAGGESVDDLRLLEKDDGLGRVVAAAETHGMRRAERRAQRNRWRKERRRLVPSPTAVFRYLDRFHDEAEEAGRRSGSAFIPAANVALRGLGRVNADLVGFAGSHSGHTEATLDMDATLIGTHKRQACYCYKKHKAYQPLTTYWHEADLVVHSEFRDGNGLPRTGYGVPAGYEQLRVLKESLECLPPGVSKVMMRSDSAGYQKELLKYCAEGRDERFGVIEFCVGVNVMSEFRAAVSEVEEEGWHDLYRTEGEQREATRQQYAEVCYVTSWTGYSKNSPDYRFIAIRERLRNPPLFDVDGEKLSVPIMEMGWQLANGTR